MFSFMTTLFLWAGDNTGDSFVIIITYRVKNMNLH